MVKRDGRDFPAAAGKLRRVIAALADPAVGAEARRSPLSDLHTLAVGFHDLAVQASAPPPVAAPTPAPAAPPPAAVNATAPAGKKVYTVVDQDAKPPVTINQSMPLYPTRPVPPGKGTLEIVIDESGMVESALIRSSVNSLYDMLAVQATRSWRYKPATVNGVPVKFRKDIIITLKPQA